MPEISAHLWCFPVGFFSLLTTMDRLRTWERARKLAWEAEALTGWVGLDITGVVVDRSSSSETQLMCACQNRSRLLLARSITCSFRRAGLPARGCCFLLIRTEEEVF